MIKRVVAVAGVGFVGVGLWALQRTSELTNGCRLSPASSAVSSTGVNSPCVQTLARYGEGSMLVLSGLVLVFIAWRLIDRQHRLDRTSLFSHVPRQLVGPATYHLSGHAGLTHVATPSGPQSSSHRASH
ncbi:MAG: hypothetical protein HKL87_01015 [Acidimicrobiaceae bacterium]|nr:hypothetical protein [Acidimicrobiaceae bacterium]